jgi:hypothetical protein
MPQELHVGYRSRLVTSLAWLLMLTGLCGLALVAYQGSFALDKVTSFDALVLALLVSGALLALTAGQALLRRYEWGRRLAVLLLLLLVPALPVLPLLADVSRLLTLPGLAFSVALVWSLRELGRPVVKREFA